MDERQEKIKKLAESLFKSGLAVNETEAVRQAEEIIITGEKVEPKIDVKIEKQSADDLDITQEDKTVNELMSEAGVDVDEVKGEDKQDKEEIVIEELAEKQKIKDFPISSSKEAEKPKETEQEPVEESEEQEPEENKEAHEEET